MPQTARPCPPLLRTLLIAMALAAFATVLLRTAWISDDAAITLRTVLNTIHGWGPRFNLDERVQAYTHPLWFLALSALSLLWRGDVFAASHALSIGVSLATLAALLWALAPRVPQLLLATLAVLLSQAFIDFSTSGLENPLAHALVLLAYGCAAHALRLGPAGGTLQPVPLVACAGFFIACGLAYLTRPDLAVLLAPLALWLSWQLRTQPKTLLAAWALGALPVLAWTAFSLYYYGWPFPNTAYAKLGTGIAWDERVAQGLRYLAHSARTDPLTPLVIALGLVAGLRPRTGATGAPARALALGIALYLAYVVSIGGDFMAGRFLTAPFFAALIALLASAAHAGSTPQHPAWTLAGAALLLALGLGVPHTPTVLSDASYHAPEISPSGIANERGHYYRDTGWLRGQLRAPEASAWRASGQRQVYAICGGLGFTSIHQGPHAHLIDTCALADPLLARLPAKASTPWRIGHFYRVLPANYIASIRQDQNLLSDPALHSAYDTLRTLTRAPLNDPQRLRQIVQANLFGLDMGDASAYRQGLLPTSSSVHRVALGALQARFDLGKPFYTQHYQIFEHALEIELPRPMALDQLELSLDPGDAYHVSAWVDGQWQAIGHVPPAASVVMTNHVLPMPHGPITTERLRITGSGGDGLYVLGHAIASLHGQVLAP
ncbi:hypothetical protein CK623_06105 [Vandammella animalimorsus]|uniref:Arabinofuranosyltransferase n=1 Tax=Vandammella animalimorsus TaxID=2029117 RepID=A0A2A2ARI9_9BURK|nr:hypothetical protein [Vandammella animalimorsus]PAT40259.1 hypothetical protein CK623_06105 [Vandammella animalimorsus]